MEKTTKQAIGKMRGLIIDFLHVSNTIPSLEWVEVVRSIQKEKDKLKRIENLASRLSERSYFPVKSRHMLVVSKCNTYMYG